MIIISTRNTVQKTMLLKTVRSMTNHPTADEVYREVSELCPGISRGTVYRDLNRLAAEGDIQRIAVANAADRFDFTVSRHAHCLCSVCGRVFDFRLRTEPEADDEGNGGFIAKSISVLASGVCGECAEK